MEGAALSNVRHCSRQHPGHAFRRPVPGARRPHLRIYAAEPALQKPLARPTAPKPPSEDGHEAAPKADEQSRSTGVSLRYQRDQAKAMQRYFQQQKAAEVADRSQFFGWTKANEINNGRWVMFGFAVGLLTEFATGVDFPHQFQLMTSYLGILDLD